MENKIKPFVKWVGGKMQLIKDIEKLKKMVYRIFCRFLMHFLHLKLNDSIINDANKELIAFWKVWKKILFFYMY